MLLVAWQRIAVRRGFQIPAGTEVVRLQHVLDPAVETLGHAVRRGNGPPDRFLIRLALRVLRRGKAVFDDEPCRAIGPSDNGEWSAQC